MAKASNHLIASVGLVILLASLTSCGGAKTADQRLQDTSQRVNTYQRDQTQSQRGEYVSRHNASNRYRSHSSGGGMQRGGGPRLFDSESSAARHCGRNEVVWLNPTSGVYHYPGDRAFGNTRNGGFTCKRDADEAGDRPSGG